MSNAYRGKRVKGASTAAAVAAGAAAVLLVAAAVLWYFRAFGAPGRAQPPEPAGSGADVSSASGSGVSGSGVSGSDPSGSSAGSSAAGPAQQPDASIDGAASGPEEPPAPVYDFSQPAPEREAVDNSYFDDAAFVGDSRTDGFLLYSGIGTGKNLTSNGLSIFKLAEKKVLTIGGEQYTLLEALALEQYGKVYLSLGVNELGTYNDQGFYDSYCAAIDQIRAVQPGAVIYIQGLIPLNEAQIVKANGNKYKLSNDHLRVYNDLMRRAAEEKQVVYLDLYAEFVDEDGGLPEGVSRDGVHLVKDACQRWLAYLQTHTVDFDTLYPDGLPVVENTAPEQTPEDGSVQE